METEKGKRRSLFRLIYVLVLILILATACAESSPVSIRALGEDEAPFSTDLQEPSGQAQSEETLARQIENQIIQGIRDFFSNYALNSKLIQKKSAAQLGLKASANEMEALFLAAGASKVSIGYMFRNVWNCDEGIVSRYNQENGSDSMFVMFRKIFWGMTDDSMALDTRINKATKICVPALNLKDSCSGFYYELDESLPAAERISATGYFLFRFVSRVLLRELDKNNPRYTEVSRMLEVRLTELDRQYGIFAIQRAKAINNRKCANRLPHHCNIYQRIKSQNACIVQ